VFWNRTNKLYKHVLPPKVKHKGATTNEIQWAISLHHLVVVDVLNDGRAGHLHDAAARPLGLADEVAIGEVAEEAHAVLDGSLQGVGGARVPPAGADDGGRDGRAGGEGGRDEGEHGGGRGAHDGLGGGSAAATAAAAAGCGAVHIVAAAGATAAAAATTTAVATAAAAGATAAAGAATAGAGATTATTTTVAISLALWLVMFMRKHAAGLVDCKKEKQRGQDKRRG